MDTVDGLSADLAVAAKFIARFAATKPARRFRLVPDAPVAAIQSAALHHPNAGIRRSCLSYLDHYANDESAATFAAALADPIPQVRNAALHSIACEGCRETELCAADVVPGLVELLRSDPSPEIRHKTIGTLIRLSDRDPAARIAVQRASVEDGDDLIRQTAIAALRDGIVVASRKKVERRAKRANRKVI